MEVSEVSERFLMFVEISDISGRFLRFCGGFLGFREISDFSWSFQGGF